MKTKESIKKECDARAKIFDKKKIIIIGILLVTMLFSIFVAPFIVDKVHIIDEAEKILNSKKDTVVTVTATAAAISVAVASMMGDATTPLANQIAELDIFFIIVLIAIYLLKILLIASTSLSFRLLFPAACLLFVIYLLSNNTYFKNVAFKILIFGLIVFLTVPISVQTMNLVDTSLSIQKKIETIPIEDLTEGPVDTESSVEQEQENKNWRSGFWTNVTDKVKVATDSVVNATKEMYQKAKDKFSELIDIVASLIITCCVIPLLVIVFLAWILKILFGINISTKNVSNKIHNSMSKAFITKNIDEEITEN